MFPKPKILIIEDAPAVMLMMVYLLTRAGFEILAARTGDAGLQLAQNEDPDLITLDIDLPGMNGFEICHRLKQDPRMCSVPVIFVSGRNGDEDRRRAFALGAADFIGKPFDVGDFIRRVSARVRTIQSSV